MTTVLESTTPTTVTGQRLSARNLHFQVGGKTLIDDVSFSVPVGTLTALIGPNGAGKSTLLHLMSGTLRADRNAGHGAGPGAGRDGSPGLGRDGGPRGAAVEFAGRDLLHLTRRQRAMTMALVEQQTDTEFAVTVREAVELGRIPFRRWWSGTSTDRDVVDRAMRLAGVDGFAARQIATLSGGERQRVAIARALAQQPQLLLLDEPTNHLDIAAQLELFALLHHLIDQERLTVVVALHDLSAALQHSDQVVVLKAGRLAAAGPIGSALDPDLIRDVYGVDASFLRDPATQRPVATFRRLD